MKILTLSLYLICLTLTTSCQSKINEGDEKEIIIDQFEPQASFPGGYDSLRSFISRNLKHPNEDIEGVVFVGFTVNADGSTSDFEIKKGLCEKCDQNKPQDRKSTRLNSSHLGISYAVFCLKKKKRKVNV